jgi:hypothetical protein
MRSLPVKAVKAVKAVVTHYCNNGNIALNYPIFWAYNKKNASKIRHIQHWKLRVG